MKRLSPLLLGVTLAALASAVGAVLGLNVAAMVLFAYKPYIWSFLREYNDLADLLWVLAAYCEPGAIVGAIGGILLGVWLTRWIIAAGRQDGCI